MAKQALVPCKECEDRYIGCHGTCSAYKAYRAEIDEKNRIKKEEYTKEQDIAARKVAALRKRKHH